MSEAERKSVLDLFPYFNQRHPIIFDVGSNKGEWADLLIDRCAEVHLFEPNQLLIHYTIVKYCGYENVKFNELAIADRQTKVPFSYFNDTHNGLSNIISNPKWNYLNPNTEYIDAETLDNYWLSRDEQIDFLKLDIEGAEYLALKGAKNLLSNNQIKFIQVEKAEHITVTGKTFDDIEKYLNGFGYKQIETGDNENIIFAMGDFTQNWNSEFKKNTAGMKFDFALEVGCFEGLTTTYICDNLLNKGGRIVCVDPLTDEYLPGHEDNELFVGQYDRFIRNTKGKPVELLRKSSGGISHSPRAGVDRLVPEGAARRLPRRVSVHPARADLQHRPNRR
jgi:FkbM family methyltransferase